MTKREDLRKEFLAIAELRLMKVEEMRELLSISPAASVEEVLRVMKWWQDNLDGSIPTKLKSEAHRLLSEIHSLNETNLKTLRRASNCGTSHRVDIELQIRANAIAAAMRDHTGCRLAYVYFEDESDRRSAAKLLTRVEARRIAANIAKLPNLVRKA